MVDGPRGVARIRRIASQATTRWWTESSVLPTRFANFSDTQALLDSIRRGYRSDRSCSGGSLLETEPPNSEILLSRGIGPEDRQSTLAMSASVNQEQLTPETFGRLAKSLVVATKPAGK